MDKSGFLGSNVTDVTQLVNVAAGFVRSWLHSDKGRKDF